MRTVIRVLSVLLWTAGSYAVAGNLALPLLSPVQRLS
jgi:hypothetical protein